MKSARSYRTVCISLYVEELVALDAKVEALKAAGYRKANRSTVLALAAMHIDDDELVAMLPKSREAPLRKPKAPRAPLMRQHSPGDYHCGKCNTVGHNVRTCRGREKEVRS